MNYLSLDAQPGFNKCLQLRWSQSRQKKKYKQTILIIFDLNWRKKFELKHLYSPKSQIRRTFIIKTNVWILAIFFLKDS